MLRLLFWDQTPGFMLTFPECSHGCWLGERLPVRILELEQETSDEDGVKAEALRLLCSMLDRSAGTERRSVLTLDVPRPR